MTFKQSAVFFSAGVILILGLALMGIMPISTSDIVPESQQNLAIDAEIELIPQQNDNENIVQVDDYDDDDDDNTDDNSAKNISVKPLEEMNCIELRKFAMSFETGWGSAVALHDEQCS